MGKLKFALLLALLSWPAQAQVTATEWGVYCWAQGGGAGTKWCQMVVEFSVNQQGRRFKGSVRLMRSEHGEAQAAIAGDRDIDHGSLQVEGSPVRHAPDDFDAKLSQLDAMAIQAEVKTGKALILRFTPKGMTPVAFSLNLDGYREAVRGRKDLDGW